MSLPQPLRPYHDGRYDPGNTRKFFGIDLGGFSPFRLWTVTEQSRAEVRRTSLLLLHCKGSVTAEALPLGSEPLRARGTSWGAGNGATRDFSSQLEEGQPVAPQLVLLVRDQESSGFFPGLGEIVEVAGKVSVRLRWEVGPGERDGA